VKIKSSIGERDGPQNDCVTDIYQISILLNMRGIETQPIIAYAIILVIIALVFIDRDLLSLVSDQIIVIGVALIAVLLYSAIRKRTSSYV
jgi:hypothetical protein